MFFFNQSWGIQTNIFETNIINLAVVLAVVIFFVGDAVRSLLTKRQESILSNLRQGEERAQEAEKLFLEARKKYNNASEQVNQIKIQTQKSIQDDQTQSQIQIQTDLERLKQFQNSTIYYQQQKIQKQISQKILISVNQKVNQKFQMRLNSKFHKSINTSCIESLQKMGSS
uniref:ATP synthase subunit b, chloroplastic n=1 Tax=Caulerpa cliftonii TaxID=1004391 RepID=A0A1C9JBT1_9CHLO|nr:ATP synthase CF0 subunit I [Caulerpa cliftonii]AOP19301.1 ATP synthase CF0 subunit I [Caulerpa cliftonii]